NKYLSNAGVCSRREADVLIETGVVTVNGKIITELGYKINPGDVVQYDGETINAETKRYVLLNKPKGFITTMDDPRGRKTVMSLVKKACRERIYPVGRLDRETTGLLLFTNDGDMAKKLTHPRYQAVKMYHVELHKSVVKEDLEKLLNGIDLEDGRTKVDKVEYVENGTSKELGVEIHSGKNRIVRRLFEALGYTVVKLDRVQFGGLTKKDLPRGYYRHLTEQEIAFLKMTK
ncbi:MAG: rRNA pseudouridine synthase, partial [Flavobacteriales bacterium]|nr:rRNA pseudouridine synthase [Flavobacteriales bacterium]